MDDDKLLSAEDARGFLDDGMSELTWWGAFGEDLARTVITLHARAEQVERDLLRRLWQRIDGDQEGDAPSAAEMEDGLVRLFDDMRADVERCAADENASTQEAERFRRERDEARIRGINDERERIVSCIERVIGRPVTDGGMYRADIESALNAWNDEARAERDRLARILGETVEFLNGGMTNSERFEYADRLAEQLGAADAAGEGSDD